MKWCEIAGWRKTNRLSHIARALQLRGQSPPGAELLQSPRARHGFRPRKFLSHMASRGCSRRSLSAKHMATAASRGFPSSARRPNAAANDVLLRHIAKEIE